jgi:hypothetical protein
MKKTTAPSVMAGGRVISDKLQPLNLAAVSVTGNDKTQDLTCCFNINL